MFWRNSTGNVGQGQNLSVRNIGVDTPLGLSYKNKKEKLKNANVYAYLHMGTWDASDPGTAN